jgi:hypothetical protein
MRPDISVHITDGNSQFELFAYEEVALKEV